MFYAIRGLYQLVAALLTLPYILVDTPHSVIGLLAVLVYAWVARWYRYRVLWDY
jgi:hypothetical protein